MERLHLATKISEMKVLSQSQIQMKLARNSRTVFLLACVVWLVAVGYGLRLVWTYENSPGRSGAPPTTWPNGSTIKRNPELPTLGLFIHSYCPCSRGTIGG